MDIANTIRRHIEVIKESFNNSAELMEDLGNLKTINPELLSIFNPTRYHWQDKEHKKGDISKSELVGPNSPVSDYKLEKGKATDLIALLSPADKSEPLVKNLIAVVLSMNGEQFAIIRRVKVKYETRFELKLTKEVTQSLPPKERDRYTGSENYSAARIADFSRYILKVAKDQNAPLTVQTITVDAERQQKRKDRENARQGAEKVIIAANPDDFRKRARQALQTRLSKFKSNRALTIGSADQFLNAVIEHGYMDKINIGGVVYKLVRERINFDKLRTNKAQNTLNDWDASYVEYENEDRWDYDSRNWQEVRAERARNKVPRKIKILLKLDKGAIVPYDVKLEDFYEE